MGGGRWESSCLRAHQQQQQQQHSLKHISNG
jgi:hypothetical protein